MGNKTGVVSVPKAIDYFPGMPKYTAYVKDLGYRNLKLLKEDNASRVSVDAEAYSIYFGERQMGRFTVRRKDNLVERSILMIYPSGAMVSYGEGGTVVEDALRQAEEWRSIAWHRLMGKKIRRRR